MESIRGWTLNDPRSRDSTAQTYEVLPPDQLCCYAP